MTPLQAAKVGEVKTPPKDLPEALALIGRLEIALDAQAGELVREQHRRNGVEADIRGLRSALVQWRDDEQDDLLLAIIPVDSWGLLPVDN